MKVKNIVIVLCLVSLFFGEEIQAQKPYRNGTTAANFLEIGYGAKATSIGDAFTSIANDVSAIYWNPAGLTQLKNTSVMFSYQPWYADINTSFFAAGINLGSMGTVALGIVGVSYGDMDVTTLAMQEGTGETFSANDISVSLAYSRKLAEWFSFGAAAKYISSTIWHNTATAFAFDLGVLINSGFFSFSGETEDGLNIGMSISNYGTQMQYDGMDLLQPIDPTPDERGDFKDVRGQYRLNEWELPLIFRLGLSLTPIHNTVNRLTVAVDAIHPNNNSEYLNLGMIYSYNFTGVGDISLSAGYKALFMTESDYGLTLGCGFSSYLLYNSGWKIDYSYREHKVLGGTHSYALSIYL